MGSPDCEKVGTPNCQNVRFIGCLPLMKEGNELIGVINKNILTFSEDGENYTFAKY